MAPTLSTDGTRVAFRSLATNLDPADTDTTSDIYMKNLTTADITLVSTDNVGTTKGNGDSDWPSLSGNGTKVAFYTAATNLDPGDTDSTLDVYVKELPGAPAGVADLSITKTDRTRSGERGPARSRPPSR